MVARFRGLRNSKNLLFFPLLRGGTWQLLMPLKRRCGCALSFQKSFATLSNRLRSLHPTNQLSPYPKIINTMHATSTTTFDTISSVGSSKTALFDSFIVQ